MNNLRQAAEQALEALEAGPDVDPIFAGETEDALREALAEPVFDCPRCGHCCPQTEQEPVGKTPGLYATSLPKYADPFTYIIQHINSHPYNMTKTECVEHVKKLRDTYKWTEHMSDCAVYNEPAYPAGKCDCKVWK